MENDIIPVINTIAYITAERATKIKGRRNQNIKILNDKIIQLAKSKQISWIDLNAFISDNDVLIPKFAIKDGVHFSDKTYEIWKREVEQILTANGI